MKIEDVKVWLTRVPVAGLQPRTWVFIEVDTDEGITGIGEASSSGGGGSIVVGNILKYLRSGSNLGDFRESIIGENPEDIERIWHKLFRRFTGGGGWGGFVSTVVSGIDIALWDIKGKLLGRPIYDLLGGRFRDNVLLYTHVQTPDPKRAAQHARELVAEGYTAMKTDPYMPEMRQHHRCYTSGTISAEGAARAEEKIAARSGGAIGGAHYAVAKAGVSNFTRALSKELASQGVRVNSVEPGIIATRFQDDFVSPELREKRSATIPLLREGTAEEVANVITFLISDESSYITGAAIQINGGLALI